MTLKFGVFGSVLLLSVSAFAQAPNRLQTVQRLADSSPLFQGCKSDKAACAAFTRLVACSLAGEGFGFLSKNPGENQVDGFAVDAIIHAPSNQVVDIISQNETANAAPSWNEVPRRAGNNWTAPTGCGTPPPPPPPPPPSVDLTPLLNRLTALERHDAETDARVQSAKAAAEDAAQRVGAFEGRIVALEAKPTVTGCKASIRLGVGGIPIACEVTK